MSMKRLISLILVAGVGFAAGAFLVGKRQAARAERELAVQRAIWEVQKAELESALANLNKRSYERTAPTARVAVSSPAATSRKPSAQELLDKLKLVRIAPGQSAAVR